MDGELDGEDEPSKTGCVEKIRPTHVEKTSRWEPASKGPSRLGDRGEIPSRMRRRDPESRTESRV